MTQTSQAESPGTDARPEPGSMKDIEASLAAIRADLAGLARSLQLFGQGSADAAHAQA